MPKGCSSPSSGSSSGSPACSAATPCGAKAGQKAFKRDAAGNIVATKTGGPMGVSHGGAPGEVFVVDTYELELVDGTKVEATNSHGKYDLASGSIIPDNRMDTDCHGVTFTDGEYWINDDQVDKMITHGGYHPATTPRPGDVLVYRNSSGDVVHSVTVTKVDSSGNVTEVSGLGGLETTEHSDPPDSAWHDPSATQEVWTK